LRRRRPGERRGRRWDARGGRRPAEAEGILRVTSGLELRPTRDGDLPALSGFLSRRFGRPFPVAEWEWKYLRLPGEARSHVALAGGEIVAHAGALCLPARWRGGEGGIWQLADFAGETGRGGLRPPLVTLGRGLLADLPRAGDAPWIFGFPSD